MVLGRILGWLLFAGALLAGATEIGISMRAGAYRSASLEQVWDRVHHGSRLWVESVAQSGPAFVADPGLAFVLSLPGWPLLGGLALACLFFFRAPPRGAR